MCRAVILLCALCCCHLLLSAQGVKDSVLISSITISGNNVTRRSVILRELPVQEGSYVSFDSVGHYLALSRLRLLSAGLFTTVEVDSTQTSARAMSIDITLSERFYLIPTPIFQLADRNFNVWWDEMRGDIRRINVGVRLTNNNFRGNLESLSITVQAGYTQRLAVEYIRPYVDKAQRHGIGVLAGVTQSGETYYKTDNNKLRFARTPGSHIARQYDAGISWYYRPGFATRHILTLGWHYADISDSISRLNPEYFGNSRTSLQYADLIYRLNYNGVDNWNYPLKGLKSVNYIVLRNGLNDDLGWMAQWRTETGIFTPLRHKWYAQAIIRARISIPNDVPYYFQSALGTRTDYVRGYEYYVIDGTHYGLVRFDLKRELLNHTFRRLGFRYLPELPICLYPKIFADAGIAHNPYPGNSFLHNRMLYSAGLGLDIVSAYDFKLRLEAAVNHLGQYGLYLHLNSE